MCTTTGRVVCPYCDRETQLMTGDILYGRKHFADKNFYVCKPCSAWVGCHPGTKVPLGIPANGELRANRAVVHGMFDPLWEAKARREKMSKAEARGKGYAWLAKQMGITDRRECHIGKFDLDQCRQAINILNEVKKR